MAYKNIYTEDKMDQNIWNGTVFDLNRPMTPEEMEHHHWLLEMEAEG